MADRYDILVDDNNDVYAENGDFVVDLSDNQHVQHILQATKGEYKQYPLVGVGLVNMQKGKLDAETKRKINLGLADDGYKARSISLNDEILKIDV